MMNDSMYFFYVFFFLLFFRVQGVLGYQPQELLGKICFELFHPEDETHMKESFEQGKLPSLDSIYQISIAFTP